MSGRLLLIVALAATQIGALAWMHFGGRAPFALRLVRVGALSVLAGIALGIFGLVALPGLFGGRTLTVMSGSMEPALRVGDVVVNSRVSPAQVRVGDIVTFNDPEGTGKLITHRVRRVRIVDGEARFVTKGDNTNTVERWEMPATGSLGRVESRVPLLGYLVFWLHGPLARIALIVIPALLLAGLELWRIWRPRPGPLRDAPA